jgi:CRP/FNR family cyclic AMP-dependent transcriptional regulator
MEQGALGKVYGDGQTIIRQGEIGDRMFVVQEGKARVTREVNGREVHIATLKAGDIFGEMAIFEKGPRSATVTAEGNVTVLSIDKTGFLRRLHEDPSLAYRILQQLSRRVRDADEELARRKLGS